MKEYLNILLYRDIDKLLISENINYVVVEEDSYYFVKEVPIVFNENFSFLKKYVAYDYDHLNGYHKEIYQDLFIPLKNIENNKYEKTTKVYKLKRH